MSFARSECIRIQLGIRIMKVLLGIMLFLSWAGLAQAGVVSYNGYTLDESTNIVTNDETGTQWLQWDVTAGMSISSVLAAFDEDGNLIIDGVNYGTGWTIASSTNMAELFNDFLFGTEEGYWDSDENTSQKVSVDYDKGDDVTTSETLQFLALFGETLSLGGIENASAFYGLDEDGDGKYLYASVQDDYTILWSGIDGSVSLSSDSSGLLSIISISDTSALLTVGVALVRTVSTVSVPEPGSLILMLFGLVGLLGGCRKIVV